MSKDTHGEKAGLKALVIDDSVYTTKLTEKFEKRKVWQNPDARKIFSFLPGTVLSISVKKGEKVKAGQVILTFEAMKMVNTVKTSIDGIVKEINIKAGDKVPKNLLMFELE
jgi:biotin carboxyl carrier protein